MTRTTTRSRPTYARSDRRRRIVSGIARARSFAEWKSKMRGHRPRIARDAFSCAGRPGAGRYRVRATCGPITASHSEPPTVVSSYAVPVLGDRSVRTKAVTAPASDRPSPETSFRRPNLPRSGLRWPDSTVFSRSAAACQGSLVLAGAPLGRGRVIGARGPHGGTLLSPRRRLRGRPVARR